MSRTDKVKADLSTSKRKHKLGSFAIGGEDGGPRRTSTVMQETQQTSPSRTHRS